LAKNKEYFSDNLIKSHFLTKYRISAQASCRLPSRSISNLEVASLTSIECGRKGFIRNSVYSNLAVSWELSNDCTGSFYT